MSKRIELHTLRKKQRFFSKGVLLIVPLLVSLFPNPLSAQSLEKDSLRKRYTDLIKHRLVLDLEDEVDLLNELSRAYRFRNPDSLKYYADIALSLSRENNYEKGVVLAMVRQGDFFSDLGEEVKAKQKYKEAELLIEKSKQSEFKIEFYKNISLQYFFDRELKKALETAYQSINLAREHNKLKPEAFVRHNLGFIYLRNKLYKEAHEELVISDSLSNLSGDQLTVYRTRSNLALNSVLRGKPEDAKAYLKGVGDFFSKAGELLWLSRSFRVDSQISLSEHDFEKALFLNGKSDSALQFVRNPRDKLEILDLYTQIYFENQNLSMSKKYADSTITLSTVLNDSLTLISAYGYLKRIALNQGDYGTAAKYSSLSEPIEDVLNRRFEEDNLKLLRTKLELEYDQLEKELADNKALLTQQRITLILLLLLGILCGILFLIRKLVRKRRKVNAELEEINQTKDKLFSIIGHDLKSPIGTLQELLELYSSKTISEKEISKVLPRLKENIDNSAFTLNNLLFWAQTQMNGLKSNPSKVFIKEKIYTICELYHTSLIKKNIAMHYQISDGFAVHVDANQLEIILRNIISNAIKFTSDNGKIIINVIEKGNMAELSICDDGIGMTQSTIDQLLTNKLIEPKEGTHKEKGTGLGLLISRELITLNQGQLRIESKVGTGSCFYILLPLAIN